MKVNQLKFGAILSYISMGVGYLISIFYTPIMLRLLGQSEYGLYNLVASVVAYLGILNFGFGSAYIKYYSTLKQQNDDEGIAKLNGMFFIIFACIGLVAILAGLVLVFNSESVFGSELSNQEHFTAQKLMIIMVVNIAISFVTIVFNSHITANEKFVFQKLLQLVKAIANPFLVLPILFLGYGSIGMVVVTTFLNISIGVANYIFCKRKLQMRFSFRGFDFSLMKKMTIFSSYIFIGMVVNQINWNVDKFILGRFHGTIPVAIYGLAAQLNTYYVSLSTTISSVFIPRVHKLVAEGNKDNELSELFNKVGRIQFLLLGLICSGLIVFGKPFIRMWAGVEYDESYIIALLLVIPATIPLIQNIGIQIQRAKNMHKFRSLTFLFIAVLNIGITIPLAMEFQGVGAAVGTALSIFIGNGLIMNWYYHTRLGLDMKHFWCQIFSIIVALIIPVAYGIIISYAIDLYQLKYFLLGGVGYIIIYVLSVWFFAINEYEKELIAKPLRGILRK